MLRLLLPHLIFTILLCCFYFNPIFINKLGLQKLWYLIKITGRQELNLISKAYILEQVPYIAFRLQKYIVHIFRVFARHHSRYNKEHYSEDQCFNGVSL